MWSWQMGQFITMSFLTKICHIKDLSLGKLPQAFHEQLSLHVKCMQTKTVLMTFTLCLDRFLVLISSVHSNTLCIYGIRHYVMAYCPPVCSFITCTVSEPFLNRMYVLTEEIKTDLFLNQVGTGKMG